MPKSCFEGYLTNECNSCCWWKDGSDPVSMEIGCGCPFPIMECEAYAKMHNEEEKRRRLLNEDASNL